MDIELKNALTEQGEAIENFRDTCLSAIADERKEREALELRLTRANLKSDVGFGHSPAALAAEHRALASFVRTGNDAELKTLSVGSDPDGGYTVLPAVSAGMTTRLFDMGVMRKIARVETIDAGDSFEEILDQDEAGASWVGEATARTATDTPQLGKISIPLNEIYSLQPVTQKLLETSGRDIGAWITSKITDKFARSEATAFISGDGVGKPRGILDYTAVTTADATRASGTVQYVKTGHASAFAATNPADALISLMYALRVPYRQGAVWLMNSATAATVAKFKDLEGRYIYQQSLIVGAPATLLGYPVMIDENMPDLGANNFPIAFGNFSLAYCIVDRPGLKLLRDPYSDKPNVLFYGWKRVGGGLANDDCLKILKCEL